MNSPKPLRRAVLRRGVVILPSAFTLANLFLGFWAIVAAIRGQLELAGWLVVIAAVMDLFDGRIARFTRTGSEFGAELDSLVDAISFGVAPALIVYSGFLRDGRWGWVLSFIYVAAAVMRLARFNVEQAGRAKSSFHGLPSPTAGCTLATFFPFSQTDFFRENLAHLPWTDIVVGLMVFNAALMLSHVLYPVAPRFSFQTANGLFGIGLTLVSIVAAFTVPRLYFFPLALTYIAYGLVRGLVMGFMERLPDRDPLIDEDEDEQERPLDYVEMDHVPHRPAGQPDLTP